MQSGLTEVVPQVCQALSTCVQPNVVQLLQNNFHPLRSECVEARLARGSADCLRENATMSWSEKRQMWDSSKQGITPANIFLCRSRRVAL